MRPEPPTSITLPFTVVTDSREQAPWKFTETFRHYVTRSGIRVKRKRKQIDQGPPYRFVGMTRRVNDVYLPLIVPLLNGVTLKSGDYSIRGYESRVTIERKSRGDWLSSITHDRPRFEREMERFAEFDYAAVVIESDRRGIDEAQARVSLAASDGTIAAWSVRFGVHFFLLGTRRDAEVFTLKLLEKFWERAERERKEREEREFIEGLADSLA